nr:hypothetical protein [Tanacetum cinerariifolium]
MEGFKIAKVAGVNRLRLSEGFVSCSCRGGVYGVGGKPEEDVHPCGVKGILGLAENTLKGLYPICITSPCEGMKEKLSDGGWSNYVANDAWKLLEFERNNPIQANPDCIGDYGLMINDNDFKYMCDYLLSKYEPFTINKEEGRLEEKRCKLLG